jgi:hypothetical protein
MAFEISSRALLSRIRCETAFDALLATPTTARIPLVIRWTFFGESA